MATSFDEDVGISYDYSVNDKLKQDNLPPSAIKINKLPTNGIILKTESDGTTTELKVGDIIQSN